MNLQIYASGYYRATTTFGEVREAPPPPPPPTPPAPAPPRAWPPGAEGPAAAMAMRILLAAARVRRATHLIPISAAHVDSCLYHGPSSLDFVRALLAGGGRVRVPTTLNVGGLDLSRPDLFLGSEEQADAAGQLMAAYRARGCQPTVTCAPYPLAGRPAAGTDVAWAESNAIVFGNSMIGLRTDRYGDLVDICAALTGRVPYAGLHVPARRAARMVFTVDAAAVLGTDPDLLPALLGYHVGRRTGPHVPALDGLDGVDVTEDWGKAFGAAAASSGGVALFHVVGVTPEAPDLATALQRAEPIGTERVTPADLETAHRALTTASRDADLGAVSVGTPHLSVPQLVELADRLADRRVTVPTYATTSRSVLAQEPHAAARAQAAGVTVVQDTCTYGASRIIAPRGAVMTNSAKWAYYAPSLMGFDVVLAGLADCVESAVSGRIVIGAGRD